MLYLRRKRASCRQCVHSLRAQPTAPRSMTSPLCPCSRLRQHQREGAWQSGGSSGD